MAYSDIFLEDPLSKLVGFFIIFFTAVIFIYSLGFIKTKKRQYYSWFLLTAFASLGVVFSKHLLTLIIFWGFLGLPLFKLINLYSNEEVSRVAKKTFIIVGGSDGFLLVGFLVYMFLTANASLMGGRLIINDSLSLLAFIFIAIGCFAKAGCMPLHTWVPEVAESAPTPVAAYLPASLDKLLGIYLLTRAVKDMFILDTTAKIILISVGSLTIIAAVMMALVQHNIKKLLGYHAVSQVGYMVLGLGCHTSLGMAASLFHMINNAIYKCCLFLGAGNIEKRGSSSELNHLGGLGRFMPVTFITVMVASFSISGIPPFNGFVSKWMLYQGLIDFINSVGSSKIKFIILLSLVCALVGSGLTLASFLKLNAGVFLGHAKKEVKEAGVLLLITPVILSLLCIVFGIFANFTILPFLEKSAGGFCLIGLWKPTLALALLILGLIIGFIVFKIMSAATRESAAFIGGENLPEPQEIGVADFYNSIKELGGLRYIYRLAEKKFFDIYEQLKNLVFLLIRFLRYLHNGVLSTYLVWCLLGMLGLFFVFFK